ncbi:MAG: site-specific integrase [Planctomycetes bacterium]|nr:site-specific integrase [Planctomycetota bacterium]
MPTTVSLLHEPKRSSPWVVRWYGLVDVQTGKQQRHGKLFKHHEDARRFHVEKRYELSRGVVRENAEKITLDTLIADFREARLSCLSFPSKQGYDNTITQLLEYFAGSRKINSIDRRSAEAFIATRTRRDGRDGDLSSWSKVRHLIHCRSIMAAAVEWGYLATNPFETGVRNGSSPLCIRPRSRPWHHITPEEFQRLIEEVPTVQQRAVYWLMYGSGLRPGEVYNLRIDNIDLQRRRVHIVNRQATANVPPFTVKSDAQSTEGKERSVPVPASAIPCIAQAAKSAMAAGGFIVLTSERFQVVQANWRLCRAGKPWAGKKTHRPWLNHDMMNNMRRNTHRYFRKAGIELSAPLTLTTFRKSFAQNHADHGTPPRTLAKLLGHANPRMTLQYYNRVTDANEQAAAETMDRLLEIGTHAQSHAHRDAV